MFPPGGGVGGQGVVFIFAALRSDSRCAIRSRPFPPLIVSRSVSTFLLSH